MIIAVNLDKKGNGSIYDLLDTKNIIHEGKRMFVRYKGRLYQIKSAGKKVIEHYIVVPSKPIDIKRSVLFP